MLQMNLQLFAHKKGIGSAALQNRISVVLHIPIVANAYDIPCQELACAVAQRQKPSQYTHRLIQILIRKHK